MTILRCEHIELENLRDLLSRYGMKVTVVADGADIPGSFWKPPEAGLIDNTLYIRGDTPVHSALHESCHFICMDGPRRDGLDTDAGGDYEEEDAVCFLQIVLADHIPEMKRQRMLDDMDAWGYSFRLGSARTWFSDDAEDALAWLQKHRLLDNEINPCWTLRH